MRLPMNARSTGRLLVLAILVALPSACNIDDPGSADAGTLDPNACCWRLVRSEIQGCLNGIVDDNPLPQDACLHLTCLGFRHFVACQP